MKMCATGTDDIVDKQTNFDNDKKVEKDPEKDPEGEIFKSRTFS